MLDVILKPISGFIGGYWGIILGILTIFILWLAYNITTKKLRKSLTKKAYKSENVQYFMLIWRYVWLGILLIFIVISFSGSLVALGISAAFLGMILGWSLQAPVTGLAAWLMIILTRPFRIGDRIIVSGIIGDVKDITLTHIILNQVGGTTGGEEKSGRGVLIPNAILFQQVIHNYTLDSKYILDEVGIVVTFDSDLNEAERVLLEVAHELTADIIKETGEEPFVRAVLIDWGVKMHLRYQTLATERQRASSDIAKRAVQKFNENKLVEFSYPHTEILYSPKAEKLIR